MKLVIAMNLINNIQFLKIMNFIEGLNVIKIKKFYQSYSFPQSDLFHPDEELYQLLYSC